MGGRTLSWKGGSLEARQTEVVPLEMSLLLGLDTLSKARHSGRRFKPIRGNKKIPRHPFTLLSELQSRETWVPRGRGVGGVGRDAESVAAGQREAAHTVLVNDLFQRQPPAESSHRSRIKRKMRLKRLWRWRRRQGRPGGDNTSSRNDASPK